MSHEPELQETDSAYAQGTSIASHGDAAELACRQAPLRVQSLERKLPQAEAAAQHARAELALLYEIVDEVSRAATLDAVFGAALSATERGLCAFASAILLYDEASSLRACAWRGLAQAHRACVDGYSPWRADAQDARPFVVPDVEHVEHDDAAEATHAAEATDGVIAEASIVAMRPALRAAGIRALAFVPLCHQQTLLGALVLCHAAPREFTDDELRMSRSIATQLAHAVARKRSEAEIARLFSEAETARSQAESASRMKDEFLAVVSHELRTPMSAILGWSAILKTERRADLETLQKGIDVIERNARAQTKIIEDILDVSRIVAGKLVIDPRPFSLSAVVADALDVVRASAAAKDIRLSVCASDEPSAVSGDPERLRQVIWNLLSNAIKFTGRGGYVEVVLHRERDSVTLEVRDSGRGIAPEFLPHVFERFRQADSSTTRAQSGLGLGLSIVRHLVELHGGRVRARSAGIGHGSTFTVTLPLRALGGERADQSPSSASQRSSTPAYGLSLVLGDVRVLVVDDEHDARDMLLEVLSARGASVRVSTCAMEAVAAIDTFHPHVLVSDIGMPERDGYWLIGHVRSLPTPDARLSAIALTAYARPEERKRALDAGYDEHLAKPTDPETLTRSIAALTGRACLPSR